MSDKPEESMFIPGVSELPVPENLAKGFDQLDRLELRASNADSIPLKLAGVVLRVQAWISEGIDTANIRQSKLLKLDSPRFDPNDAFFDVISTMQDSDRKNSDKFKHIGTYLGSLVIYCVKTVAERHKKH